MKKINHKLIINFFEDKLREIYLPDEVIKTTIDSLVNASLFGIDSHGVNLFEHYYLCLQNIFLLTLLNIPRYINSWKFNFHNYIFWNVYIPSI